LKRPVFHFFSFIILAVGPVVSAYPQSNPTVSPSHLSALDVSPSARAAGLGDCFAPLSDDSSALYFNPAGLSQLGRADLSVMHLRYTGETVYESAAYAMPFQNQGGGWGVRLGYIDYGSFPHVGNNGATTGYDNDQDLMVGAGLGIPVMKDLSAGLQTSWTSQTTGGSTHHGLWWDLGFLAQASQRLQFGLALKNMGVVESGAATPFALEWGFAFRGWDVSEKKDGLLLCAGSTYAPRGSNRLNAGLEFNHQERFFFRIGYSPDLKATNTAASQGVNVGAGFRVHRVQTDYTLTLGDASGEFHRVSLSYLFPTRAPRATPRSTKTTQTSKTNAASQSDVKLPSLPANPNPPTTLRPLQKTNENGTLGSIGKASDGKSLVVLPFQLDDTATMSAEECLEKGQGLERQVKWREALKCYLIAVEKKPNLERAWLFLGNLQVRLGMDAYREALRLNPGNETLRQWLDKPLNK
jgi:hypothetical protein